MLNAYEPDPCCGKPLAKALHDGLLDTATKWTCPKCGCDWQVDIVQGGVKFWSPHPLIQVLKV